MWLFTAMMFFIFIILGVTTGITPLYSRSATPFGVAVVDRHEFVDVRKRRYAKWNIIGSVLLGLPLFIFPFIENYNQAEMWSAIYTTIGLTGFLVFSFILYLKYRKEIREWKKTLPEETRNQIKKVVVDTQYHNKLSAKGNFTFFIWQFAIVLVTVLIAFAFYDRIPEEIPVHWNSQFEVDRTIEKSVWGVLALPALQLLMIPVFNYSNYSIIRSKQKLSPLDPKTASEKSRRFREVWSNFLFWMTIATQLLISFLVLLSFFGSGWNGVWMVIPIVLFLIFSLGGTLYLTFKYGQAGEKLLTEDEQYYVDPDDDEKWLLGMIYYNKEDPSVFVEKRFGIGTTLNMARWQAWAFVGGILAFLVATIVWSVTLG